MNGTEMIVRPEDAAAQGEFHWRMAGSPAGERDKYVDEALREALTDALADTSSEEMAKLNDEIEETKSNIGSALEDSGIPSEIKSSTEGMLASGAKHAAFLEGVVDLVKALCKELDKQISIVERRDETIADLRAAAGEAAEPRKAKTTKVRVVRPAARPPRPRRGDGTIPLFPVANDVREVVKAPAPKPKKKAKAKAEKGKAA